MPTSLSDKIPKFHRCEMDTDRRADCNYQCESCNLRWFQEPPPNGDDEPYCGECSCSWCTQPQTWYPDITEYECPNCNHDFVAALCQAARRSIRICQAIRIRRAIVPTRIAQIRDSVRMKREGIACCTAQHQIFRSLN